MPLITDSAGTAGRLNLGTTQHNFDASNPLPTVDGIVAVPLSAGAGGGFTKTTGGSTILLAADNSGYTGSITINAGYLAVDRATSLGAEQHASPTINITGGAGIQAIMNDAINPLHNPVQVPNNFTLNNADLTIVGILDQALDLQGKFTTVTGAPRTFNIYNLATTSSRHLRRRHDLQRHRPERRRRGDRRRPPWASTSSPSRAPSPRSAARSPAPAPAPSGSQRHQDQQRRQHQRHRRR